MRNVRPCKFSRPRYIKPVVKDIYMLKKNKTKQKKNKKNTEKKTEQALPIE